MFKFKGSLVPPTVLGIVAIGLGAWAILSPNRQNIGSTGFAPIWIVGAVALLFGVWILIGVVTSAQQRRK
ncbi:hypothetical protein EDF23_10252 [Curtobacterium sp. PhB128]|nr:hypothetical protein EDF23_10252 [Curtobacterium sp. PhB128]TCL98164.1 hypothetical protein EDF29_102398 [Curtobacterium sp. PhB138]